jgi:hypothetical protein
MGAAILVAGPSPKFSVSARLAHGSSLQLDRPNGLLLCPEHQLQPANQVTEASFLDGNSMPQERREATR